jgi:hypothetical protein
VDCLSKEILMYSRYVDEKLLEYLRTQKEEVKAELRTAQEKLDRLILGNKLSQDEIDMLIRKEEMK